MKASALSSLCAESISHPSLTSDLLVSLAFAGSLLSSLAKPSLSLSPSDVGLIPTAGDGKSCVSASLPCCICHPAGALLGPCAREQHGHGSCNSTAHLFHRDLHLINVLQASEYLIKKAECFYLPSTTQMLAKSPIT